MDAALSTRGYQRFCRLVSFCCALVILCGWLQPAAKAIWGEAAPILPAAASSGNLAASDTSPETAATANFAQTAMLKAGSQLRSEARKLPDPGVPPAVEPTSDSLRHAPRIARSLPNRTAAAIPAPRRSQHKPTGPPSLPS